jgi:hypothetical protein
MIVVPGTRHVSHALGEIVTRHHVESRSRLIEHQRARRGDERPCEQHAPRFAGRHLVQATLRQMRHTHARQRVGRAAAHLGRHGAVAKNPLRREET